jgi:hypothetical protein
MNETNDKIEQLEARITSLVRLNNELHERVYDLEEQVIKSNDNLQTIMNGMKKSANTFPIIKVAFMDFLDYIVGLVDWDLTIDVDRHRSEEPFVKKANSTSENDKASH